MLDRIVSWLEEKRQSAGAAGYVVGLSGGIDSAVVAGLCKRARAEQTHLVIMPCESDPADARAAREAADFYGLVPETIDLSKIYRDFLTLLGGADAPDLARANLKPRLRMATLYFKAQSRNALVVGTGNRDELMLGYFTKYGDGGTDLLPIGGLVKSQVRDLGRQLGLPESLVMRPPSAGLWPGQTDEQEMGLSYEAIDAYLLHGRATAQLEQRILDMMQKSEHKRAMPPVAPIDD